MMGPRLVDQAALFYEFSLERHVPAAHLLRAIDRFVDLSEVRGHLAPFYSSTGRPSIDPELLVRMLLVGYCYGIRSERRLCEEVHLNLAYSSTKRPPNPAATRSAGITKRSRAMTGISDLGPITIGVRTARTPSA